jgi:hypothetical protein
MEGNDVSFLISSKFNGYDLNGLNTSAVMDDHCLMLASNKVGQVNVL